MPSFQQFTAKAKEAFRMAQEHAVENGHQNINPLHLFVALVGQEDGLVQPILQRLGIDPIMIYDQALSILESRASAFDIESSSVIQLYPTPELALVLENSGKIAHMMKETHISTEHISSPF